MRSLLLWTVLVGLAASGAVAGALLEPEPAPEWQVSEWINGNPGNLRDHRGKVVLIEFFQLWCPGCNRFSIPLFESWHEMYRERDDVLVVSIHTVFEGHDEQNPDRLRAFVRERGIDHPVGIDAYTKPGDPVPITMDRFETEGTPHIAIVDKRGQLVFSHFGEFERAPVEAYVERLLKEKDDASTEKRVMRAGEKSARATATRPPPAPRRPSQRRQPPPKPTRDAKSGKRDAADDAADRAVAGTYRVSFEQSDKSCGSPLPVIDLLADLIVSGGGLEIRVRRPFLGLSKIIGTIDVDRGDFRASTTDQAKEAGADIELSLELSGSVDADASPPTIAYEFVLEKTGPTPDWECIIEGRGSGTRTTGPRRR